jgi:membrane fusion protein (multidrug efflux system)
VSRIVADQARTEAETSAQNVNTARATLAQAVAQLALAEKAVADVVVAAPFAGFISERKVSVGEYVQPSTAVVTLLKIDPLRLQLPIPGVQAGQIAIGQTVTASVDAFPELSFTGRVTAVNPQISAESRSFTVEATVPNPKAVLKPGMFAVATIDQGRTTRALLVPRRAVVEDTNTNSYRVFVIDKDNRARIRVVQLAARQHGDVIKILTGVEETDRVATTNLADLYDGLQVEVE